MRDHDQAHKDSVDGDMMREQVGDKYIARKVPVGFMDQASNFSLLKKKNRV